MRRLRGVTPQEKMVAVNNKFGNTGIKKQQGTTRVIYDTLPLAVATAAQEVVFPFFKNCQNRSFPFTNLTMNKLQVGETLTLESFYVAAMRYVTASGITTVEAIMPLSWWPEFMGLYRSDLNFYIGENGVIKDVSLNSMQAQFNDNAHFSTFALYPIGATANTINGYANHDKFELKTDLVIPPDIQFEADVTTGPLAALPANPGSKSYALHIAFEGAGSLLAPRSTF